MPTRPTFHFHIQSDIADGPLAMRPVLLTLFLCIVLWLGLVGASFTNLCIDHYFPYEGKVVAIKNYWTDYITFETTFWDHLIIETPDGALTNKMVGRTNRIASRIEVGDYVVKAKGFSNPVYPRDKWTTAEFLQPSQTGHE